MSTELHLPLDKANVLWFEVPNPKSWGPLECYPQNVAFPPWGKMWNCGSVGFVHTQVALGSCIDLSATSAFVKRHKKKSRQDRIAVWPLRAQKVIEWLTYITKSWKRRITPLADSDRVTKLT